MKTIGLIASNYISGDFGKLEDKRTLASLPFGGRYRLIDFALSNMVNAGLSTVGIITPFNSGSLIDHVGVGKPWKLDRKVGGMFLMPGSVYGMSQKGIRFPLKDILDNKAFLTRDSAEYVLVAAGSDVYSMDYTKLIKKHAESGNSITMCCKRVENGENYKGYFVKQDAEGTVTEITSGAYGPADYFMDCFVINREYFIQIIDWFEKVAYLDFFEVIKENFERVDIGTYMFEGYYGKINTLNDYMKVSHDILDMEVSKEIFNHDSPVYTKVQDEPPAFYTDTAKVKNSLISAGCKIEGTVENSILFRSTHVAKGAVIKNSVVMMHGEIGENTLLYNVICDKYVTVSEDVNLVGGKESPLVIGKGRKA